MEKAADVLKIAIENEIRAKVFYSKAAEITDIGESQMVFTELTEMEDQHAVRLVKQFGELLKKQGYDADEHLRQSEAHTEQVLTVEETDLIKAGDMRAVLRFAIEMEARARDNYRELAGQFDEGDARAFCDDLAAEEQDHFETLSKLLVSVDMDIDERPAL